MPSRMRAVNNRTIAASISASINKMFGDGFGQSRVRPAAIQIGPRFDGDCIRLFRTAGKVMPALDVGNRIAIGDHVPAESPILAQMLLEQHGVGACRRAVDRVIGAHD